MDQSLLVRNGHDLIEEMAKIGARPRAALWVNSPDTDNWRLWIVPDKNLTDKREFYRKIAEIINQNPQIFSDFDAGDVEMIAETHPAMAGLKAMFKVHHNINVQIRNNMVNGYYIPDGVLLTMNL
jgi:hypothetical protein